MALFIARINIKLKCKISLFAENWFFDNSIKKAACIFMWLKKSVFYNILQQIIYNTVKHRLIKHWSSIQLENNIAGSKPMKRKHYIVFFVATHSCDRLHAGVIMNLFFTLWGGLGNGRRHSIMSCPKAYYALGHDMMLWHLPLPKPPHKVKNRFMITPAWRRSQLCVATKKQCDASFFIGLLPAVTHTYVFSVTAFKASVSSVGKTESLKAVVFPLVQLIRFHCI